MRFAETPPRPPPRATDFKFARAMAPSVASTRASSSRRDKKIQPGAVKIQLTAPTLVASDPRDAHVAFSVKTRATAREYILQCRSELRDGHATFDVQRRYGDFVTLRTRLRESYPGAVIPPLPKAPELEGERARTTALDGDACEKRRQHLVQFLTRCGEHPMLYNSTALLMFLTENDRGAFVDAMARRMLGAAVGGGASTSSPSAANPSWFGQMFGSTRTISSVLKDEDPQYLQVIEYTKKIEDQIVGFRESAREYMKQLEQRVNATRLLELGKSARAMGECESGWGRPLARRSKCVSLGTVLGAFADCAESLTGEDAHELQVVEHMKALKREFKDCLRMLGAVRETFEDRAETLLHYEITCDRYDEVVRQKGRALATVDPDCLAAEALMKEAKERYDMIVERMRDELPRFHRLSGNALTRGLRAFARASADLAKMEAEMWGMLLRDDDASNRDAPASNANGENTALWQAAELAAETPSRPLTTMERARIEREERRADRARRRAAKEERAIYKQWKATARQALAEGRPVPPRPGSSAPVAMPPASMQASAPSAVSYTHLTLPTKA